jgi:hypothetical protein
MDFRRPRGNDTLNDEVMVILAANLSLLGERSYLLKTTLNIKASSYRGMQARAGFEGNRTESVVLS